jgi:hypothetical protein
MSDQLVIRTMKDDIAGMNSVSPAVSTPVSVPVSKAPRTKREKEQPPVFSLPSKPTPLKVMGAANPVKKRKNIWVGIGFLALFLLLVGGGIYSYMIWGNLQLPGGILDQEVSLSEVIPKEALVLVDYNLETESNRSAVKQLWSEHVSDEATEGLTVGNPTDLLTLPDVMHAYYVVMPDNQIPFLVVKKTESLEKYFSQQSDMQLYEKGGWYILHASNVEQYRDTLASGSITENSSLLTSNNPTYLVRYAMSPAFVSQQFNGIAASTIGLSQREGLAFDILTPSSDGTIRASAHIAGSPSSEGVLAQTSELVSLLPSDLSFGHIGLNFADELNTLQADASSLDGNILAQPAIRQFIAQFATPYGIFERKGADGIRDIGLIIALPTSLKQNIKTGEAIVEQALPALIPLVVGKALGIQVTFTDGLYNAIPLRYVNLNGQTQTLDYTIGDNYLVISSSREGIYSLIDTSLVKKQGLSLEEPWKGLEEKAGQLLNNKPFVVGTLKDPIMKSILPVASNLNQIPVIVSSEKTNTGTDIQAVLLSR